MKDIARFAIIGCGLRGCAIAEVCASAELDVIGEVDDPAAARQDSHQRA